MVAAQTELIDEFEGEQEVEILDNGAALMALNKSEIDTQIATAKRWPRSIKRFKNDVMELACLDEETAASMFYVLKRSGKKIEGPSVRMAEAVGSSWGNLRYGTRVVSIDDKFVTSQGMCFDLEKNIAITVEVKRRITDKQGRRYSDDMITTTANAAMAIALRNAVFKVVPFALVKSVYEQAKLTSIGRSVSMAERRQKAVEWFGKIGVTPEQILQTFGREGIEDITVEDLVELRGLHTAIKDGETTVEDAFGTAPASGSRVRKSARNDAIPSGNGKTAEKKPTDKSAVGKEPEQTAADDSSEEPPEEPPEDDEPAAEQAEADQAHEAAEGSQDEEPLYQSLQRRMTEAADLAELKAVNNEAAKAGQLAQISGAEHQHLTKIWKQRKAALSK